MRASRAPQMCRVRNADVAPHTSAQRYLAAPNAPWFTIGYGSMKNRITAP